MGRISSLNALVLVVWGVIGSLNSPWVALFRAWKRLAARLPRSPVSPTGPGMHNYVLEF